MHRRLCDRTRSTGRLVTNDSRAVWCAPVFCPEPVPCAQARTSMRNRRELCSVRTHMQRAAPHGARPASGSDTRSTATAGWKPPRGQYQLRSVRSPLNVLRCLSAAAPLPPAGCARCRSQRATVRGGRGAPATVVCVATPTGARAAPRCRKPARTATTAPGRGRPGVPAGASAVIRKVVGDCVRVQIARHRASHSLSPARNNLTYAEG